MAVDFTGFDEAAKRMCEMEVKKNKEDLEDLRDWFAGMAMQGLLAQETEDWCYNNVEDAAARAYQIANAMLKEREK